MKRMLVGIAGMLAGACLMAAPLAQVRLCHEDAPSYPWLLADGQGLSQQMMRMAADKANIRIIITPMPWVRCMREVKAGMQDGLVKISFMPERMSLGVFPMKHGAADPDFRMLTDDYHLYRRKGESVMWDGKSLSGAGRGVAAQTGFSVAARLRQLGVTVDEGSRDPVAILHKLALGRVSGAALQNQSADAILASSPELSARIERVGPALQSRPYYLIFSQAFQQAHPDAANRLWQAVSAVRNSAAYRAIPPPVDFFLRAKADEPVQ